MSSNRSEINFDVSTTTHKFQPHRTKLISPPKLTHLKPRHNTMLHKKWQHSLPFIGHRMYMDARALSIRCQFRTVSLDPNRQMATSKRLWRHIEVTIFGFLSFPNFYIRSRLTVVQLTSERYPELTAVAIKCVLMPKAMVVPAQKASRYNIDCPTLWEQSNDSDTSLEQTWWQPLKVVSSLDVGCDRCCLVSLLCALSIAKLSFHTFFVTILCWCSTQDAHCKPKSR